MRKSKKEKRQKPYSIKGNSFEVYLPRMGARYSFGMSDHAVNRAQERNVNVRDVVATVLRVSHLIDFTAGTKLNRKVVIPSYQEKIAVIVEFRKKRGTIVTILDYPAMSLPEDVPVLDCRLPER